MYIVEGNIGVGKSVFLKLIQQYDSTIAIIPEPKENWTSYKYGQSLLANFYEQPKRWAYTLETLAMICRARDHLREQKNINKRRIIERSIYSGHYCFAYNDYENGYLNEIEWKIYNQWVSFIIEKQCHAPHGFIYLKADPEVCFQRVQKRNRMSEKNLTLDYMKQIHAWHEQFLIKKTDLFNAIKKVPVLVLNCNEDFLQNSTVIQQHIAVMQKFIQATYRTIPSSYLQSSDDDVASINNFT